MYFLSNKHVFLIKCSVKKGFLFKGVCMHTVSRFGTTGRVWYRGDFCIKGVQFKGVTLGL